jgi:NAD-dependent SIR2 family protein deacetylase
MDTAHKTEESKKEHFDEPKVLEEKVNILVAMIKKSQHMTAFTGAGISTSTGIADFRSGKDTVLATGPGAWEKKALKLKDNPKAKSVSSLKAVPSKTHMALV